MRFENFTGLKHRANGGTYAKNDTSSYTGCSENNDLKHNSYPFMNNQNVNLTKAERDHILLFDPHPNSLNDGLSGSLTGKFFYRLRTRFIEINGKLHELIFYRLYVNLL